MSCDECVERLTGVAGEQCKDCPHKESNDNSSPWIKPEIKTMSLDEFLRQKVQP